MICACWSVGGHLTHPFPAPVGHWLPFPWGTIAFLFALLLCGCGKDKVRIQIDVVDEPLPALSAPRVVVDARGHTAAARCMFLIDNDETLLTCGKDNSIRFWNVATGECIRELRISAETLRGIHAASLSMDQEHLALSGPGNDAAILSLTSFEIVSIINAHPADNNIPALAFAPDNSTLLTGSDDKSIKEWDWKTGQLLRTCTEQDGDIRDLTFSPDGRLIASACADGFCRIYDRNMQVIVKVERGQTIPNCVEFIPGSDGFVVAWEGGLITTHGAEGEFRKYFLQLNHWIQDITVDYDGSRLLYTSGWSTETPEPLCGIIELYSDADENAFQGHNEIKFLGHSNLTTAGRFFHDGQRVVTLGGNHNEAIIWNSRDGSEIRTIKGQGAVVRTVAWSLDGTTIAWGTGNDTRLQKSFNLHTLKTNVVRATDDWVYGNSQLGRLIFFANSTGMGVVTNYREPVSRLKFDDAKIQSYATALGRTFISGNLLALGTNHGLYLFDVNSGRQLRRFAGPPTHVWSVSASPTEPWILCGNDDMTLRIYHPNRNLPLLTLFFADDEWAAWTPCGYYAASPGGEDLIGWCVSRGPQQLTSFFPVSSFRKDFFRPELIRSLLRTGSVERTLKELGEEKSNIAELLSHEEEVEKESR